MAIPVDEISKRIAQAEEDIKQLALIISQIESGAMQEGFGSLKSYKYDLGRAEKRLADLREKKIKMQSK